LATCLSINKGDEFGFLNKVLVIGYDEAEKFLSMREALEAVEHAFELEGRGQVVMPAKQYLELPNYRGDFRAMPCYVEDIAGLKWVSVYPDNTKDNYPCVTAVIILSDPHTGFPLAVMDGTYITKVRTGAAGGVAIKYLARKKASTVGIIGTGTQARTQLLAIREVLPNIDEVKAFDISRDACRRYAEEMQRKLNINVHSVATVGEATAADIIVTATPARQPILEKQHIRPGTHINAIGADAKGKQELDVAILGNAKIVVDNMEQAFHSGEVNVPLSKRLLRVEDIYGTVGEIVSGVKRGRENDDEITVFDSTGIAVLDILCASLVYEKACKEKSHSFDLFRFSLDAK
jgi:alanine dehydrogenase